GKTVPQIALNWLLQRPTVSTVIIGARDEKQLKDNLGAIGWNLTAEQVKTLDHASEVTLAYPYWHQKQFRDPHPFPTRLEGSRLRCGRLLAGELGLEILFARRDEALQFARIDERVGCAGFSCGELAARVVEARMRREEDIGVQRLQLGKARAIFRDDAGLG